MSHWLTTARQHPSAVLLFVQVLSILVYPYLGDATLSRALFSLLGIVALGIAVLTVARTPSLAWVSAVIGLPLVVLTVLEGFVPHSDGLALASALLHSIFYFYTGIALIRSLFSDDEVTSDELFSTGATFTVVAWAFAYLYSATQILWPGSFNAAIDSDSPRTWIQLLFLSVTTLTSTGLSDIAPIRAQARSFVMIEQIAGMLYLALVVARITALTARQAARRHHQDDERAADGRADEGTSEQ